MAQLLPHSRITASNCSYTATSRHQRPPLPFQGGSLCTQHRQQHKQSSSRRGQRQQACSASRRNLAAVLPATWLVCQGAAFAEEPSATAEAEATTASTSSSTSSSSSSSSSIPSSTLQQFIDNEYELSYPSNYIYKETPIVRVERGPQPERSPVLARFEAPDEQPGAISIIMRRANSLKQTILQVNDISQLGNPIEVAQLILPRGSTLLATATTNVPVPPKQTPLGLTELPPQTYYRYEFTTPQGDHVAMSAAARRGSVYICGASMTVDRWKQAGPVFGKVVKSFRIRTPLATL